MRKYKDDLIPEQTESCWNWPPGRPAARTLSRGCILRLKERITSKPVDDCKSYILEIIDSLPALEIYRTTLSNPGYNIFHGAPTLVLIFGNQNAFTYPNDCSMAALNLMLAAWERGIGSCWIGFARAYCGTPEFKEELEVPPEYQLVAPVILGYPADPPGRGARKEFKFSFHQK